MIIKKKVFGLVMFAGLIILGLELMDFQMGPITFTGYRTTAPAGIVIIIASVIGIILVLKSN